MKYINLLLVLIITTTTICSNAADNNLKESTKNVSSITQSLHFTLKPENSYLYIDSTFIHKGGCTVQLKPGTYKYQVKSFKYHDVNGEVRISDKNIDLAISLPIAYGRISILSENLTGATILLDDKELPQRTPCVIENIKSGDYLIQLNKDLYQPYFEKIKVEDGKTTIVNCNLVLNNTKFKIISDQKESNNEVPKNNQQKVNSPNFIEMVFVKGGTFEMGASIEEYDWEPQMHAKPKHNVSLNDFYIGKTELTQEQWFLVMHSNPSISKGDNFPVENVSWKDVQDFISKLNLITGKKYRLPTEAEWEYAAQGGVGKGTLYSGTDDVALVVNYAWANVNSDGAPHAVATAKPNKLGLYDMSGNVWEWCSDWLAPYDIKESNNPKGPLNGIRRVHRGGSWNNTLSLQSIRRRGGFNENSQNSQIGFRLVLEVQK